MGEYIKKKKEMKFQSVEALQQVVNVVNEAAAAVSDKSRTIRESAIPEVLMGALGAGIGGVGSFAALYSLGSVVGLSAAGITSGLAAAGSLVGGGMVAGVFVLAAPVAILAAGGVGLASHLKNKQLRQEKERLYKEALAKHQAIIKALKDEAEADKERLDYLQSLNILLARSFSFCSLFCASSRMAKPMMGRTTTERLIIIPVFLPPPKIHPIASIASITWLPFISANLFIAFVSNCTAYSFLSHTQVSF